MQDSAFFKDKTQPPEFGELSFSFEVELVSNQSTKEKKDLIKNEIRKITRELTYLLCGDIKVEIQWLLHEQDRYENAHSPDMDNIIKPILDGLVGVEGIMIDDCQVQTIATHWIDWTARANKITITIQYISEEYIPKNDIAFVNIGKNLYIPINTDIPWTAKELILNHYVKALELRNEMMSKKLDYYSAKLFMPIQRLFHKSRVFDNYTTFSLEEFRDKIETERGES